MFTWLNWYLSAIIISIFLVGCKMTSTSNLISDVNNKVNVNLSGSKETGIQINK